jgi:hypothetical protein
MLIDLAEWRLSIALQRAGATDRALAQRRKTAGSHEGLGFRARAYVRADDAERAHIEQARGVLEPVAGDADHRRHSDGEGRDADLRGSVEGDRAVLHVDEERIETARIRNHCDLGGSCEPRRHAQRNLAARKPFLHAVRVRHDLKAQLR